MLLDQCEHNVAVGCAQCKQIKFAKAPVFTLFDNCGFCLYLGPLISIPSVHVSNTYCSGVFMQCSVYMCVLLLVDMCKVEAFGNWGSRSGPTELNEPAIFNFNSISGDFL